MAVIHRSLVGIRLDGPKLSFSYKRRPRPQGAIMRSITSPVVFAKGDHAIFRGGSHQQLKHHIYFARRCTLRQQLSLPLQSWGVLVPQWHYLPQRLKKSIPRWRAWPFRVDVLIIFRTWHSKGSVPATLNEICRPLFLCLLFSLVLAFEGIIERCAQLTFILNPI